MEHFLTVQELNDLGPAAVARAFGLLDGKDRILCPRDVCMPRQPWIKGAVGWRCERCGLTASHDQAAFALARAAVGSRATIDEVLSTCARLGVRPLHPTKLGRILRPHFTPAPELTPPRAPLGSSPSLGGLTIRDVEAAGVAEVAARLGEILPDGRVRCPMLTCMGIWQLVAREWVCTECDLAAPVGVAAWRLAILSLGRLIDSPTPNEHAVLAHLAARGLTART
jgi:hypothetical protein